MFEIVNNRQIIFGENKINSLVDILTWYKKKKVFFVTSTYIENISKKERIKKVIDILNKIDIEYYMYDKVNSEPDLHVIDNAAKLFNEENCDCTIALGGGSVIDVAKAVGMLALNGGSVEEYQMNGLVPTVVPPLFIAIPTTSGTGAEATKVSVVFNNNNGLKKSLYHTTMIADFVILDPTLTFTLPSQITASTGMDALSHAIESYVSLNANILSEMYGLKAIELINENIEKVFKNPNDLQARGNMMLGSYFGGYAITAGVGIAHIMAQPIGALFHISHGDACSIFLPVAMTLNINHATAKYVNIAKSLNVYNYEQSDKENANNAIVRVKEIIRNVNAPSSLKPFIKEIPTNEELIDSIKRTTGHITCNPRPLDEELMLEAFNMAL